MVDRYITIFRAELAEVEPDLSLTMTAAEQSAAHIIPMPELARWLDALHVSPCGVHRMSLSVEGVVETSNNLAVVTIENGHIVIENMVRSLVDTAREEHAETIAGLYRLLGAEVNKKGAYPGWKPNMASSILKTMSETHKSLFGEEPEVEVIHAGLECGLLGSTYPHWDMISFGPTIRFPHSPDEKVHIASVANFWRYLQTTLKNIPQA